MHKDDRTAEQMRTHTALVTATDKLNWGLPAGANKCAWACEPNDVGDVYEWVSKRSDMKYVNINRGTWKPRNAACVHIYVVGPNHPALNQTT